MMSIIHGFKEFMWSIFGISYRLYSQFLFCEKKHSNVYVRFNTAIDTDNLGDEIIMNYCSLALDKVFAGEKYYDIPTHSLPSSNDSKVARKAKYSFLCGTNILSSNVECNGNWKLPNSILEKISFDNLILLGVGWKNYEGACSAYSRMVYRCLLSSKYLHSVRDSYTEEKLKTIGINNVLNTGCPTMWNLTPEFCRTIPKVKSKNVVTTITAYRQDVESDNKMLHILGLRYDTVYLWIQGTHDREYLTKLKIPHNLLIIPESVLAYESALENGDIDYVGTRLHAGILALNHGVRSLVVAVDNRSIEIAKDTNLNILLRTDIPYKLDSLILGQIETRIHLPQENIDLFLSQFN